MYITKYHCSLDAYFKLRDMENDYLKETNAQYIKAIEAIDRCLYNKIIVINPKSGTVEYASSDAYLPIGMPSNSNLKKLNMESLTKNLIPEDKAKLEEIRMSIQSYFKKNKLDNTKFMLNFSLHYKIPQLKNPLLINHKITHLNFEGTNGTDLLLCILSLANCNDISESVLLRDCENDRYLLYSFQSKKWKEKEMEPLTLTEKNVIILSALGYKEAEIAEAMCKSVMSIKKYKSEIFRKANIDNITSAILISLCYSEI